jgi:osmotically-inducible protein OsmY
MADRWDDRNQSDYRDGRGYRDERHDRGVVERGGDEVRSWFGDDEAARRRRMDQVRDERHERDRGGRAAHAGEHTWERARETARDWTDRDHDGRRGLAEWNDADRPRDAWRDTRPTYGAQGDYSSRERGYGVQGFPTSDIQFAPSATWSSYRSSETYGPRPNYTGRGPRGYQRGDERIREDICDRLTDDSRVDASDIEVHVKGGEVTLAGSVRSRIEKRVTEDVAEQVSGVREVNNNLKVRAADEVLGTARSGASPLGLTDTPPPPVSKQK